MRNRGVALEPFSYFKEFFPLRQWLDCKPVMRERAEFKMGNDAIDISDKGLCAFLGVLIVLSNYNLSIEECFA